MTPTADLMKLVENHISDLRRCAVLLDSHTQFRATAAEIRKAADELHAALTASCDARVGGAFTVQWRDNGWTIYYGRTHEERGWNLGTLTETTAAFASKLQDALNATPAQPKASEPVLCGCGRPADYMAEGGALCCNKYGIVCQPKASEGKTGGDDARDAARYRWLKMFSPGSFAASLATISWTQWDAAIDAAMTATLTAPGADDGQ